MAERLRELTCNCCGGNAGRFQQHSNRDTGYGMCADCIKWVRSRGMSEEEIRDLYGIEGVNFALTRDTLEYIGNLGRKQTIERHDEPTYENQLWHARKLLAEKGAEAVNNPHAMIGRTCGCGTCFCCAAKQVLDEADGLHPNISNDTETSESFRRRS